MSRAPSLAAPLASCVSTKHPNPHEKSGRVKSNNLMAFDDIAETAGFPQNGGLP
jgi:hypothetical protein